MSEPLDGIVVELEITKPEHACGPDCPCWKKTPKAKAHPESNVVVIRRPNHRIRRVAKQAAVATSGSSHLRR